MECRIAGVVPVAGNWSGECCIAVRQMLAGRSVSVKMVETLQCGRIHAVDILLSMGRLLYGVWKVENKYRFVMGEVGFVIGIHRQEICRSLNPIKTNLSLCLLGKPLSTFLLEHGYAATETDKVTPTEQEISKSASLSHLPSACTPGL